MNRCKEGRKVTGSGIQFKGLPLGCLCTEWMVGMDPACLGSGERIQLSQASVKYDSALRLWDEPSILVYSD